MTGRPTYEGRAPGCVRCQPRSVPRRHLAASLHCAEPGTPCACLIHCGADGCTGADVPVVDKPTRRYTPPKKGD